MCKRKGERRSRCAIPKNIHGSSRAPTPTDNPSVNFVDSSPCIGEPKVRFTVHKQTLPPLCKGRWHAKHDGGIGAAAESYQKQKTTPQALSRQLPLHRGAKLRTKPVGTGVPDCPHPCFPLFHRVFHIAFPPENPDFTAFSRVFHLKNKHFSTFVVHNSVEKHRKRNYTT